MDKSTQQPVAEPTSPPPPAGVDAALQNSDADKPHGERTTPNLHIPGQPGTPGHVLRGDAAALGLATTLNGPATPQPSPTPDPASEVAIAANLGAIPGPLQQWDRYQIQKLLGQGGMGTVFLARDRRLGRAVALKWLRVPSAEAAERLQQEARAQARLDHSGICKVFEVGEFLGQPYIAMEYINGQPLNLAVRRKNLEQKVMLMRQIALAVHAAHMQGILHRDIKPANIMVCTADAEASGEGGLGLRPVLMDFGLARDALGPQRLTQTGVIMGTPQYMAPEQARGQARHLDRRADVYSLGAVLYELLSGKPPFDAENEVDLLLSVLNQDPQPLRLVEASVPPDLEIIVQKCLQKEPAQRYESALALADDLGRYLRGEPIVARPASTLYRLRRLALRHRAGVAVGTLLVVSLLCFLLMMLRTRQQQRLAAERGREREQMAAQLGKTVTELKLFLRVAYSLPPHDLRREQKLIKGRLEQLEHELPTAEPSIKGALEGAIGQGYLALGDSASAIRHIELALQNGYEKRGVHLALGQALGRIFEQKRDEVRRSAATELIQTQIEALRREYVVRARQELIKGSEGELGSADYVNALLHFYESDSKEELDKALAGARKAQEETPWLLEPFDLEVKIRLEQMSAKIARGLKGDAQEVAETQETLTRAIDIGRSYPNFYLSNNQFALVMLKLTLFSGGMPKDVEEIYRSSIERAKVAVTLMPDSGDAYDQLARLYSYWTYLHSQRHLDSGDALEQGLKAIAAADKLPPERAEHYFVRGRLFNQLGEYKNLSGGNGFAELSKSIADSKRALSLDPGNVDYLNTLAVQLTNFGKAQQDRGVDSIPTFKECIATAERATVLRPQQAIVRSNLGAIRLDLATEYVERGIDPAEELSRARADLQLALAINPKLPLSRENEPFLKEVEMNQRMAMGQDITAQSQEIIKLHKEMLQNSPASAASWEMVVRTNISYGESLVRKGESPLAAIAAGLEDLQAGVRAAAISAGMELELKGQLLLLQARWLAHTGKSPQPVVAAYDAMVKGTPGPHTGGKPAQRALTRASLLRVTADWQSSHGLPAAATVAEGLAAMDESERMNSGTNARMRAERGALLAVKARTQNEPGARKTTAQEAAALLRTALHDSPPLTWNYRPYLEAMELLLKTAP